MNLLKNIAVRITALLVFFAMIAAVILYQAGVYDISFIKRPPVAVTEESKPPFSEGTEAPLPPDTSDQTLPPPPPVSPDDAEQLLSMILSLQEMTGAGWKRSSALFGSASSLARLNYSFGGLKNVFGARTETVTRTVIYQREDGFYDVKTIREEVLSPSVRLYYGLILFDDGKTVSILNADGKTLVEDFTGALVFATSQYGKPVVKIQDSYFEIDREDGLSDPIAEKMIRFHALRFDSPSYYAYDSGNGPYPFCEYVKVYTEVTAEPPQAEPPCDSDSGEQTSPPDTDSDGGQPDPPGTDSGSSQPDPSETESSSQSDPAGTDDEPQSSDSSAEGSSGQEPPPAPASERTDTLPLSEKKNLAPKDAETVVIDGKTYTVETVLMWGYRDAKGKTVIEPQYEKAFDFTSDGIAAVVDFERRISFINRSGKTVITLNNKEIVTYNDAQRTKVKQSYFEPVSQGIENLGMYYFDRGYVMVRYVYRGTVSDKLYLNENRLLSRTGQYFDIPSGYSLINYSDGILLLEKNGRYGYMDLNGGWVAPAIYDSASPFLQGLAVVGADGKYGLIDTEGNQILPLFFDYISEVSDGIVCTYEESRGWELYCVVAK